MKLICWLVAAMATVGLVVFAQTRLTPPQGAEVDTDASCRSIDREMDAVFTRLLEKDRIVKTLLRGELTIDQAVDGFRELISHDPKAIEFLQGWYGVTGDEIFYRNVVSFVKYAAEGQPEWVTAVASGLKEEVDRRFGSKISTEQALP